MTYTDIDKQLMEVVKNNWHSGAGEIIDFDKFLYELNESVHQLYSQAKAEQREEIKQLLLETQFYNPGVTRYLKITEEEIDNIFHSLKEEKV